MNLRFATPAEVADWDQLITTNQAGTNVLQCRSFAELKADFGWTARYFVYDLNSQPQYFLGFEQVFKPFGKLWYLPKAPNFVERTDFLACLTDFRTLATQEDVFLLKIEPEMLASAELSQELTKLSFRPNHKIQPDQTTIFINTALDDDQLFASFPQRGRRAVRQAEKNHITIVQAKPTEATFQKMYQLMQNANGGEGVPFMREYPYYQRFWQLYTDAQMGQFYFAKDETDEVLSGAFISFTGDYGFYKDGGSMSGANRKSAAHKLQWEIMRDLHARGIAKYNLHSTPPADQLKNPNHPYYGLGIFKTSFSKDLTEFCGCWDLPLKPLHYALWNRLGERLARRHYCRHHSGSMY
jgi:methicillin resistance protein